MMQLTISKVLKGNCNMMFKKTILFALILYFIIVPDIVSAEGENVVKAKDVLFIYDAELTGDDYDNIAAMADILTYMGYGTTYSTVEESIGRLGDFDSVLFYHESDSISSTFINELKGLNNKLMLVGGGAMPDILAPLGMNYRADRLEDSDVRFSYSFGGKKQSLGLLKARSTWFFQGKFPYEAGNMEAGGKTASLCLSSGRFSYLGLFSSKSDILKAVFSDQISRWKWPYENMPNSYPQYVIFDNVYPFFKGEKMLEAIDLMTDKGIPYSIAVSPVYQNTEYPAMKHFCEILRYAQSKGAVIVLKAPIINTDTPVLEDINGKLTTAITAYNNFGVYPLAIEAPDNWIHEKLGLDVLRRFSTVILFNQESKNTWTDTDGYNTVYSDGHKLIAPALFDGNIGDNLVKAYPTAVFLDMNADLKNLEKQAELILQSQVPLKSLRLTSHTVYTNDRVTAFKDNRLSVNGEVQSLDFIPFSYEENFNFNRGVIGKLAESIERENRRLLIIVTGISILFIFFIGVARYQNRRRFLFRSSPEKDSKRRNRA